MLVARGTHAREKYRLGPARGRAHISRDEADGNQKHAPQLVGFARSRVVLLPPLALTPVPGSA